MFLGMEKSNIEAHKYFSFFLETPFFLEAIEITRLSRKKDRMEIPMPANSGYDPSKTGVVLP